MDGLPVGCSRRKLRNCERQNSAFRETILQLSTINGTLPVNGRWTETLTTQESQAYEEMMEKKLGIECARWFASGAQ
jgi:hypothetical protein